jgi:hydrogenase maturation protease
LPTSPSRQIVIGIGNPDRGDDGAGRAVVQRLAGVLPPEIELAEETGEATAVMARFEGVDEAFLVDACLTGAPAGTISRFDVAETPLPEGLSGFSTHGFGLGEAIELARVLQRLPRRCIVYAIEGAGFETGAGLSAAVDAAVVDVANRLHAEVMAASSLSADFVPIRD